MDEQTNHTGKTTASGQHRALASNFLGFINDNHLFAPTDRVLLAVSGGLDSVVMADLFRSTGRSFAIAHVNFSLRGAESDADAVFVKNIAERYGVPFHLTRFDTAAVAHEQGISIQMAARDLRYAWFEQLLGQYNYARVATAHHQNDVLETMLLNLVRGTGLAGLHGIAPRVGNVVRPVLFATREQLADYAHEQGLTHRDDSSNADDKYARNRLRHHVVPVLTDLNPNFWPTLARTVERLRAAETLVRTELGQSYEAIAQTQGEQVWLPAPQLLALSEPTFRLSEWLKPFGFTADQVHRMMESLSRPVGQVFESATHRVTHDRQAGQAAGLRLEPLARLPDFNVVLSEWPREPVVAGRFTLTFETAPAPTATDALFSTETDPTTAWFDADRLTFPLTIRPWRPGDRFQPLGLNGRKLVSNLLNDLKLTRSERAQTAVLLSGNRIAWVIGRRIDHRFRVTAQTGRLSRVVAQPVADGY